MRAGKRVFTSMKSRMTQNFRTSIVMRFLYVAFLCTILASTHPALVAQPRTTASSARWTSPKGSWESTRSQFVGSFPQPLDSLVLRWSTNSIAGDIQPLVGNVLNDSVLPGNVFSPQEILAVVGGDLLILDATGRVAKRTRLPSFVSAVSAVFDENQLPTDVSSRYPSVIALETIERRDSKDSLAVAYLAALDSASDSIAIVKRLTVDVAPFSPNLFAAIRPFFAEAQGNSTSVYCSVDMSSPVVDTLAGSSIPFFRGITAFSVDLRGSSRQLSVNDTVVNQFTVAPSVSFVQPAVATYVPGLTTCVLPCWPDTISTAIPYVFNPTRTTIASKAYVTGAILQSRISPSIAPSELVPDTTGNVRNVRPRLVPSYVRLTDAVTGTVTPYILVAEEYMGRNGSQGTPGLHLYDFTGVRITRSRDTANPSFAGKMNHGWSIGTGDVDGDTSNRNLPYYPNNRGQEIVVTQTTHELACPGSRLMVLRYNSGSRIQKESKRTEYLYPFDTLVTQAIPGWVACVGDLDSASDDKAEIILVDGSTFMVLRMRNYSDVRFTQEDAFDTVFTASFPNENINALSVADIDGDGRNDIVVTTNLRCAVFGQPIRKTLQLLLPGIATASSVEICSGDSIGVTWKNLYKTQPTVRLLFQEYDSYSVPGRIRRVVRASVANLTDTVDVNLLPDSTYFGTMGRFIVQSTSDSLISDSSCIVVFGKSSISIDSTSIPRSSVSNSTFTFTGIAKCIDSVVVSYTIGTDTNTRYQNRLYHVRTDSMFSADFTAPCLSFPLQGVNSIPIHIHAEGYNSTTRQWTRSSGATVLIIPAGILTRIESGRDTLCANKSVLWYLPPDSALCSDLIVGISSNQGRSFVIVDTVSRIENRWEYVPSVSSPDSLMVRIWCPGSCYRFDTTLYSTKPKLVKKIAPNPFEPGVDLCGVYTSPSTNSRATLRIYDEHEDLVKELVNDELRDRDRVYCDYWDGTTSAGLPVADGMYYLVISYNEGSKEYYPIYVRRR